MAIGNVAPRVENRVRALPWPQPGAGECSVALLGFGTVGRSVAEILCSQTQRGLRLTHIFNRNVDRKREAWVPGHVKWTDELGDVLASDADVVVEVLGGVEPAGEWVRRALLAGKSVVTANKHLIATRGAELLELAQRMGVRIAFGASVAGAVPVIAGLEHGLSGDRLHRLCGVLNGTCNFILTNMESRGTSFEEALEKARKQGYAEVDPSDDINGVDAACKLAILAREGLGVQVLPEQIVQRTIAGIELLDFASAKSLGYTIRQVSLAEVKGKRLQAAVKPMLVPVSSPLAQVRDNQNVLVATGEYSGETVFSGRGAGGGPTAVAVVSDLLAIARKQPGPAANWTGRLKRLPVHGDLQAPHYVRIAVQHGPGMLAAVAAAFAEHGITIRQVLDAGGAKPPLVVTVESCRTSLLERAVRDIGRKEFVEEEPVFLPMLV